MSGGRPPVINPPLPNRVCPLDKLVAWALPVLDDNNNPSIELSLRVIHVGQTGSFHGDYVLNRHLRSVRLEDRVPVRVFAGCHKVS